MNLRIIAPALALTALASAQAAQAQTQACVAPADLSDAVVYALPIAFDATRTACVNRLPRDGFMATGGEAFIANFRSAQDQAWPGAFRLLKVFMAESGKDGGDGDDTDIAALVASLPEESLRPFVDALVGQMIAEQIKGDSCSKIERGLELISPLPADNVGSLFAFIAEFADLRKPPICASAPAQAKR